MHLLFAWRSLAALAALLLLAALTACIPGLPWQTLATPTPNIAPASTPTRAAVAPTATATPAITATTTLTPITPVAPVAVGTLPAGTPGFAAATPISGTIG